MKPSYSIIALMAGALSLSAFSQSLSNTSNIPTDVQSHSTYQDAPGANAGPQDMDTPTMGTDNGIQEEEAEPADDITLDQNAQEQTDEDKDDRTYNEKQKDEDSNGRGEEED